MFRCGNCGARFEEPNARMEAYEDYYGVGSLFPDKHYFTIEECPNCGSEDYEEEQVLCRKCKYYRPNERYNGVIGWCEICEEAVEVCDSCEDGEEGPQKWMNGKEVKE